MPKATISVWQFQPKPEDEGCMLTYRLAGLVDNKPFCADVSMEIDGRDGEVQMLWGHDIAPDQLFADDWDAVLVAMSEIPELEADMEQRSNLG